MSEQNGSIRLATWNIQHGALSDKYRGNPEQVAEACAALDADILALQEVDKRTPRSNFRHIAKMAAEASGMEVRFARTMRFYWGSYGNALLVRGEIEDEDILPLKGGPRFQVRLGDSEHRVGREEPRNAILATVRIGGRPISVAATHLSTQPRLKREQLPKVINALAGRPGPQVLMGDLNLRRDQVLAHLSGTALELVDGPPTFPAPNPVKSIDHIAVSGLTIRVVSTEYSLISDHRALVVDVE